MKLTQGATLVVMMAVAAGGLTGCGIERAQVAHDAQSRMVGLTKEQVLSCMGVLPPKRPRARRRYGPTTPAMTTPQTATFGQSTTNASLYGSRQFATGNAYTTGSGFGISSRRYCTVKCQAARSAG